MRIFAVLVLFISLAAAAVGDPPMPVVDSQRKVPPGLEGLVWNKWDTEHFVVISLDKSRGSSMRHEVESVRSGVLERWGISGGQQSRCKLVFVPDAPMLKKLFGLSEPRCEVRKSDSGSVEAAIWIDEERVALLPSLVAELEFSNEGFRPFVRRGVPILERSAAEVRENLGAMSDPPLATVLEGAKPDSDAADLDRNSAMLCLMVRKELGRRAFSVASKSSSRQVHEELGFESLDKMDETFRRYRAYLMSDLRVVGRVPDEYLGVRR